MSSDTSSKQPPLKARIDVRPTQMKELLEHAGLRPDGRYNSYHPEIRLRISNDQVETIAYNSAKGAITYGVYESEYFDSLSVVNGETINAIVNPYKMQEGLKLLLNQRQGTGKKSPPVFHIEFYDVAPSGYAQSYTAEAGLKQIRECPVAKRAKNSFPTGVTNLFNSNGRLCISDSPAPTVIQTKTDALMRITKAGMKVNHGDSFEIKVENGDFRIDIHDKKGNSVRGVLSSNVQGPDFKNAYGEAFAQVAKSLEDGNVELQSGPGQRLAVIQEGDHYRAHHVIAPVKKP
ncbi:hypothetical protein GJR96_07860 [Haloferax sp. MBLA0076]|uniref:Uncharacterized protein n=1 Tax=Haloferax litoreum TaxID=2666140 RepID=A0A6A8GJH9_9EURY|nr:MULTISPECIES: hypothetical protein [Haloferax]KAB1193362.1 hypothetical protein Hfx1148_07855 [Haloferax sp. CBA1148]MRX21870.1 hypothetical protein [Haloferax litoreum]